MTDTLALLHAALSTVGRDEVPPGWKTARQWRAEWRKGISATKELLRKGVAHGVVEVRSLSVWDGRRNTPIPHYRIIPLEPPP